MKTITFILAIVLFAAGCASQAPLKMPEQISGREIQGMITNTPAPTRYVRRTRKCVSAGHGGGYSCFYTTAATQ